MMRVARFVPIRLVLCCVACVLASCAATPFQQSPQPATFSDVYPACKTWPPMTSALAQNRAAGPSASASPVPGQPPGPEAQNTPTTICAAYLTKAVIDQCVFHSYEAVKSVKFRNGMAAVLAVGAVAAAPVALAAGATATTTALVASSTSSLGFALPSIVNLLPSQSQVSIEAMHKAERDYLSTAALNDDAEFRNLWDAVGSACPSGVLQGE